MCNHINKAGITSDAFRGISLYWNSLSSGELSILNLLGRLHEHKKKNEKPKDTILLIDEVDLGLHPEWQRVWVKRVLPIIGDILNNNNKNRLEVLITTHSPIILSDLANDDIIYLNNNGIDNDYNKKEKTLGQNIYKLFLNSFYLDNTQGEFSISFINDIINKLKKFKKNKQTFKQQSDNFNKIEKYIDLIGEDITRNALIDELEKIKK